jgi:uncharacterized protein with FMN-binding domain
VKRALAAVAGTVAALAALLSYKSGPVRRANPLGLGTSPAPPGTPAPNAPSSTTPAGASAAQPTTAPGMATQGTAPQPAPTTSPGTGAAPSGTQVVKGPDVPNQYGDVQVQLTIQGGKVIDVTALQMPVDRSRSAYISQVAAPMLRSEVIQAQSANIDIISGATYTSESYAQSVQAALDQARR